jgi:hypothetical protein
MAAAAAAWKEPTTVFTTASHLRYLHLLMRRTHSYLTAQNIVELLHEDEELDTDAVDVAAIADKFVMTLLTTIEAAASYRLNTWKSVYTAKFTDEQQALVDTAQAFLSSIQQQLSVKEFHLATCSTAEKREGASRSSVRQRLDAHFQDADDVKDGTAATPADGNEDLDSLLSPNAATTYYPSLLPFAPAIEPSPRFFQRFASTLLSAADRLTSQASALSQHIRAAGSSQDALRAHASIFLDLLITTCSRSFSSQVSCALRCDQNWHCPSYLP